MNILLEYDKQWNFIRIFAKNILAGVIKKTTNFTFTRHTHYNQ